MATPLVDTASYTNLADTHNFVWSHTINNNDNRILIVTTHAVAFGSFGVTTVTYNGQALTKLDSVASSQIITEIFYLTNPPIGTADVEVTFDNVRDPNRAICGATSYYNVNTSDAFRTVSKQAFSDNSNTLTPTSEIGDIVFSAITVDAYEIFEDSSLTIRWENQPLQTGQPNAVVTDISGQSGTTTVSYTFPGSFTRQYAHLAVAIKPRFTYTKELSSNSYINEVHSNNLNSNSYIDAFRYDYDFTNPNYNVYITPSGSSRTLVTDFIAGDVKTSANDALSTASFEFDNSNGKYNDTLTNGDILEVFTNYSADNEFLSLNDNLQNYYKCDNDASSTVLVDETGTANGTNTNITYDSDNSISGNSISFNGTSSYVTLPSITTANNSQYSVNFSFKALETAKNFFFTSSFSTDILYYETYDETTLDNISLTLPAYIAAVDSNNNVYTSTNGQNLIKHSINALNEFVEEWNVTIFATNENTVSGVMDLTESYVYVGTDDGNVKKVDVSNGSVSWTNSEHTLRINDMAIDSQGNVYTASSDETVKKINPSGTTLWTYSGHNSDVTAITVDSQDNVISGSSGNTIGPIAAQLIKLSSSNVLITSKTYTDPSDVNTVDTIRSLESNGTDIYAGIVTENPSNGVIRGYIYLYDDALVEKQSFYYDNFQTVGPPRKMYYRDDGFLYTDRGIYYASDLTEFISYGSSSYYRYYHVSPEGSVSENQVLFMRDDNDPSIVLNGNSNLVFNFNATDSYTYTSSSVLRNRYVNVGYTYDNGYYYIYVDGKLVSIEKATSSTGSQTVTLGQTDTVNDYFYGYMDNIGVWSGKALTPEEQFILHNNGQSLDYSKFTIAQKSLFRGKIDSLDYTFNDSTGFSLRGDAITFPELTDTTFSETITNEYANLAIDRILENYRSYADIEFTFWEENGWCSTTYDSTAQTSTWNTDVSTFPQTQDDLLVLSYQNQSGWRAIKDICDRVNLDVWIEYDDLNSVWAVRTVKKDALHKYPQEVVQWRMNDSNYSINVDTQAIVDVDNDYIDRSIYGYPLQFKLEDLPTRVQDTLVDYGKYIFTGGNYNRKLSDDSTSASLVNNINTVSFSLDLALDEKGNCYSAFPFLKISADGDGSYDWRTTYNGNGVAVTKDGSQVFLAQSDGYVRKFDENGNLVWTVSPHSDDVWAIATDGDFVYTGSNDNTLKKLRAIDGSVVWTFSGFLNTVFDLVLDDSGYIYAVSDTGVVKRITSAGSQDWTYDTTYLAYSIALDSSNNVYTGHNGGRIHVLSSAGILVANNGSAASTSLVRDIDIDDDDNLYVMGWENDVYKMDTSFNVDWTYDLGTDTSGGYAIAVDKRQIKNFELTTLDDTDNYADKEIVSYTLETTNGETTGPYTMSAGSSTSTDIGLVITPRVNIDGVKVRINSNQGISLAETCVLRNLGSGTNLTSVDVSGYTPGDEVTLSYSMTSGNSYSILLDSGQNSRTEAETDSIPVNDVTEDFVVTGGTGTSTSNVRKAFDTVTALKYGISGTVYFNVDKLDAVYDNKFLFTVFDEGINDAKDSNVWNTNYKAVHHLQTYDRYDYSVLRDSSYYESHLIDKTTYYAYKSHYDSNTYNSPATSVSFELIKSFTYPDELETDYIQRIDYDAYQNATSTQFDVRFIFYYMDGTNEIVNSSPNTQNNVWREFSISNPNPEKRVSKVDFYDDSYTTGNRTDYRNFKFVNPWSRPTDELFLSATINIDVIGSTEVIVGADDGTASPYDAPDPIRSFRLQVSSTGALQFVGYFDDDGGIVEETYNGSTISASTEYDVAILFDGSRILFFEDGVNTHTHIRVGELVGGYGYAIGAAGPFNGVNTFSGSITNVQIGREGFSEYDVYTVVNNDTKNDFYTLYNGDVLTDSVNSYHGTFNSSKVSRVSGRIDKALNTDSSSDDLKMYSSVPDSVFTDGAFSVSFWTKTSSSFSGETLVDSESFETDLGDWTNDVSNVSDWIRNSGLTGSTNTGPSSAQDGSWYIYVETSSGSSYTAGDTAIIEYDLGSASSGYVEFYYHQYGGNQGTLSLEGYDGSWNTIWSSSGNQGDQWNFIDSTSTTFSNYTKLRFRNVAAGSFEGDVALDLIKVYSASNTSLIERNNWSVEVTSNGNFEFVLKDSSETVTSSVSMNTDTWYFVTCVYDPYDTKNSNNGSTKIYVKSSAGNSIDTNNLSGNVIDVSYSDYVRFASDFDFTFDDVRIFRGILYDYEIEGIYSSGFGSETLLLDSINDAIQSVNLMNVDSSNVDTTDIINRIVAYGETISDNIITVYTINDEASQSEYWTKDKIITDASLSYEELELLAKTELRLNSDAIHKGEIEILGAPSLLPAQNITVNIPNCKLKALFRVKEYTHNLGHEFTTNVTLSRRVEAFRDLFVNKYNTDDFVNPAKNPNNMEYSYMIDFDESPVSGTLSGTEVAGGILRLTSTSTTGTFTTDIITAEKNITTCEFRRYENYYVDDDVIEVTNDGGTTWEEIDKTSGVIHTFTSTGRLIGFRITMNRTATTDPTPAYEAVSLLYK